MAGFPFLLDLEQAQALRDGDGLVLEDGRVVEVLALPEPLAGGPRRDSAHLQRSAWQIGNRHLEAQIETDRILIRRDHVIADMLERPRRERYARSTRSSSRKPAPMPAMVIAMTTDAQQLQLLLAWMSPAFPVGGFAYSHGLERAIEDGTVTDADDRCGNGSRSARRTAAAGTMR